MDWGRHRRRLRAVPHPDAGAAPACMPDPAGALAAGVGAAQPESARACTRGRAAKGPECSGWFARRRIGAAAAPSRHVLWPDGPRQGGRLDAGEIGRRPHVQGQRAAAARARGGLQAAPGGAAARKRGLPRIEPRAQGIRRLPRAAGGPRRRGDLPAFPRRASRMV